MTPKPLLNSIRQSIEEQSVSWGELAQLQGLGQSHPRLFRDNSHLAEWAEMPESKWRKGSGK